MNGSSARWGAALSGAALLVGGLTGCTSASGPKAADITPPNRDSSHVGLGERGTSTDPLVLRLGTADGSDAPTAEQVEHLASVVAATSHHTIRIEPVFNAEGEGVPHWDQVVATEVIDGDLEMGLVPTRAWDQLGVSSLQALTTPFLITDEAVTSEVAQGDLAAALMTGLPDAGVEGLALYPEGLRHPFAYTKPLRGAHDYAGASIRAAFSKTSYAMLEALGATPVDDEPDPTTQLGAESSYRLTPAGTATGNVTFFPKVNALVINADTRANLSAEQRAVLSEAATATRDWVIDTQPTDAEAAATFCAQQGRITGASPQQLTSLERAVRPVVADLRRDPNTARLIDQISRLRQDSTSTAVTSCPTNGGGQGPVRAGKLNGEYTFTITPEAEKAGGVTNQDLIDENAGDFTVTFTNGTWTLDQRYTIGPKAGQLYNATGSTPTPTNT